MFVCVFQRGGALLSKRLEELEATVKKLEEEKAVLKQDNATLVSVMIM